MLYDFANFIHLLYKFNICCNACLYVDAIFHTALDKYTGVPPIVVCCTTFLEYAEGKQCGTLVCMLRSVRTGIGSSRTKISGQSLLLAIKWPGLGIE